MAVLRICASQQQAERLGFPYRAAAGYQALWLITLAVQALLDSDPKLTQYEDHFQYRYSVYQKWKKEIEEECGTLAEFARVSQLLIACSRIISPSSCCISTALQCCLDWTRQSLAINSLPGSV